MSLSPEKWKKLKEQLGARNTSEFEISRLGITLKTRGLNVGEVLDLKEMPEGIERARAALEFVAVEPYGVEMKALLDKMTSDEITEIASDVESQSRMNEGMIRSGVQENFEDIDKLMKISQLTSWLPSELFELEYNDAKKLWDSSIQYQEVVGSVVSKYGLKDPQKQREDFSKWIWDNTNISEVYRKYLSDRRSSQLKK